jgi:hypothetical protein
MYKFLGRGKRTEEEPQGQLLTYFPGVPARDLDDDEVKALGAALRKDLIRSGLYEDTGKAEKKEDVTPAQTPTKDKSA